MESSKIRKINNLNARFFKSLLVFFICSTSNISAQDFKVKPLTDYLEVYKTKKEAISKAIKGKKNISIDEKLAHYETEISKLKEKFKSDRTSEYNSKSIKRAKRHTCTGSRIRGVTDCKSVYLKAPDSNMYTKEEWVNIEGAEDSSTVIVENSSVSLRLTATGKRINKAIIYATFKYIPERITEMVNKETVDLFNLIVNE